MNDYSRSYATEAAEIAFTPVFHLSEEEALLKESVAKFSNDVILPKVREMDEAETMDRSIVEGLFEQGLMSVEIEEDFGGSGMGFTAAIVAIEELAKVDPSVSAQISLLENGLRDESCR